MTPLMPPLTGFQVAVLYGFYGLGSIGMFSLALTTLWWQRSIWLGESGILWDRRVILWSHMTDLHWSSRSVLQLGGVDQYNIDYMLTAPVPADRRDAVEELLDARVGQRLRTDFAWIPLRLRCYNSDSYTDDAPK